MNSLREKRIKKERIKERIKIDYTLKTWQLIP